ncbi:MAG: serine/threonine protein kinase [Planctomycetes bacterium]|nr:serine/threonine protein kinase [Planctomycetota bacterium]
MNSDAPRSPDPAAMLGQALATDGAPPPWPAPTIDSLAAAFPDLAVHALVGQGGMAAVYHATQVRLGRAVALKVMRPDLAKEPQFAERFLREAKALATLSNPHVLAIHDFGERAGHCYLVTEFVDGANLRELMQLGRLSPDEVLRIVPQICAGLHFAHQHGVVHRDIKPENVLVDRHGQVKLADFGLAKLAGVPGPALTRASAVMGTPHYMAPEQWYGSAGVDHRADIYSLGVVLYELLTGRLPIGTYAPASAQPGVPAGVDQVVQRSLQQEPELRYQSARDVQDDLERQRRDVPPPLPESGAGARGAAGPHASATRLLVAGTLVPMLGLPLLAVFLNAEHELFAWRIREWFADDANRRLADHIVEAVGRGEAWTSSVPQPSSPSAAFELQHGLPLVLGILGGLVLVTVTMLLGAAAWRRTRHLGASRIQQMLGGMVFALLPVGSACVGLCAAADKTQKEWLLGVVGVVLVVGVGAFLRWLWQLTARRRPGIAGPLGRGTRTSLWLAGLVTLGIVVTAVAGPRHVTERMRVASPIEPIHLLGSSRQQVLDRLGPPLAITTMLNGNAGTWMVWSYRGLDGQERTDALQFDNGIVSTSQHLGTRLVPSPRPANGAHAGMTFTELLAVLGPATQTTSGESGMGLEFADGTTASVSPDGIVLHVGK